MIQQDQRVDEADDANVANEADDTNEAVGPVRPSGLMRPLG